MSGSHSSCVPPATCLSQARGAWGTWEYPDALSGTPGSLSYAGDVGPAGGDDVFILLCVSAGKAVAGQGVVPNLVSDISGKPIVVGRRGSLRVIRWSSCTLPYPIPLYRQR